jgi:Outer membrane protein beta-barrel domain
VELPVQLVYSLPAGPGQLLVGAGLYAAVAVGGSINGQAINFNTSNFRKLDLGATASVGYELTMGLSLSAYYAHGLTNISKNSTPNLGGINPLDPAGSLASLDPSSFGGTLYNRSYGISIGYLLPSRR